MNSSKTIVLIHLQTGTISVGASTCVNETAPIITFTGANGTGTVQYSSL